MTIYAITLTHNGSNHLEKLYPTIKSLKTKTDFIWFIRDNNSTDNTDSLIKSWNDELFVRHIKINHNRDNFSKGNNDTIKIINDQEKVSPDDYYLFLNNDITIEDPNSINYMLNIFDRDPDVGIVGARLFYPKSKMIQHAWVAFSIRHGDMPWHIFSKEKDSSFTNQNRYFQAVTGAFLLIRTPLFHNLKAKGMDERFNWAFDDINMCLDVNKIQNKKIVYCGQTNITHYESATLEKNKANILFMKQNVDLFKKTWKNKYTLDYDIYKGNANYNVFEK